MRRIESQIREPERSAPKHWRKGPSWAASASFDRRLYVWRHFSRRNGANARKIMLAVLPFENLTGDLNKEYLADGLTEETISLLGRLNPEQLGVIARTSVMGYKHKDETPWTRLDAIFPCSMCWRAACAKAEVTHALPRSSFRFKDQTHLWSQDYDYLAKDILNVQDDVAKAVAREIRLRLSSQQQADLARSRPVNPEAFDAYLQGTTSFNGTRQRYGYGCEYFDGDCSLIPPMLWLGLGCLGCATGRPT